MNNCFQRTHHTTITPRFGSTTPPQTPRREDGLSRRNARKVLGHQRTSSTFTSDSDSGTLQKNFFLFLFTLLQRVQPRRLDDILRSATFSWIDHVWPYFFGSMAQMRQGPQTYQDYLSLLDRSNQRAHLDFRNCNADPIQSCSKFKFSNKSLILEIRSNETLQGYHLTMRLQRLKWKN